MAKFSDDGTIPRHYDTETGDVVIDGVEIPSDADLQDLIDALVELGLITVAEA